VKFTFFILFVLICVNSWLHSVTHHIKQDGTGNFTTIQEGIIAATDNDTILVYPGIYYENIDYLEKSLTVASLYIITPEDSLINQTIIDGNQQARCVKIDECENASIIGFTIQNGYALESGVSEGYQGGGLFVKYTTNALIANCKINNNKSYTGGGIYIRHGNIDLTGNIISKNRSITYGGGLSVSGNDTIIQFSQTHLNNIFLNYSGTGADLYISHYIEATEIIVDTFTVSEPDYFFLISNENNTFSCLNSKIEEIDQNLFVSPYGDDNNSGLTPEEPLQTIAWAQMIIKRNNENPNTIHLAEGTYSPSLNNQIYPLNVKHGVLIEGASSEETILDADGESSFFYQSFRDQNEFSRLVIQNLKMINGDNNESSSNGCIRIYQADINLTNVIIENCNGGLGSAILTDNGYCYLENVIIRNNFGGKGIYNTIEYNCPNPVLDVSMINTKVECNYPGGDYSGGGIIISGHSNIPGDYYAQMINCEIIENYNNYYYGGLGGPSGLGVIYMDLVDVVNCTFGDNTVLSDAGCTISTRKSELNLFNSIVYNNEGNSLNLLEDAVVNITNSLIEDGDDNVYYYDPLAVVNWLDGNLDENPIFDSLGIYPFALLENSPCINAGTLDMPPEIELPEFDLAGNPRIYGETIDMGAYEYQGDPQSNDNNEIIIPEITQISNYPNPFNPTTTIKLDLAESGKIELVIYNIKGQKVKTLLDAHSSKGHFEIIWNGVDDNKRSVASGQYFIKLKVNGKEKAVRKCVLLK